MKTILIFVLATFLSLTSFSQIVTSGNIAKYYFNAGNPHDDVGSNDGVIYGAVLTEDRFGNTNQAYHFLNAFIRIDHNEDLDLGDKDFSLSIWFKTDNNETFAAIVNKGQGTEFEPRIFIRTMGSQQSTFQWRIGNGNNNITRSHFDPSFFDDNWHHIVLVRDDNNMLFYLDANLVDNTTNNSLPTINTDSNRPFLIGVQDSIFNNSGDIGYGNYFDGSLDDFRIYNRAINALEVDSLFNEQDPTLTSISDLVHEDVKIYPNPSEDYISIELKEDSKIDNFKIYDLSGKLHVKGLVNASPIDITKLNSGIYFIHLFDENELVGNGKIVKTRVE